jgi:hypothetical protein
VAYAQDVPSGEWVQLSTSPKDLTCRTYDIYSFDPLTGTTSQVSNLREADEYDPSWSPNGKMVAHDVVTPDSHAIYVTDVATGESTPLAGAEDGGNDAAWSPKGNWIAFDRRWVGDPTIYIVPPGGGDRIPLRENAVFASWSPNGMRLVFTDNNDGSIRTIGLPGGKGAERLVAAQGESPAWSPDGKWIAYNYAGHIWKVAVNAIGTPMGQPIQVTSGPFTDGAPAWSADNQTIFYDAGFGGDWDIWTVPAAGGEPTWLTGAPVYGEYGPNYTKKTIGFASVSPNGQAARTWTAAFTYDLPAGFWSEGTHTYHFEAAGQDNTPDLSFNASTEESLQEGTVLLRPWSIIARSGEGCSTINNINPDQPTRFFVGWTADGTYPEALAYYQDLQARVAWDDGLPVDLDQHEVFPFTSSGNWFDYACTYTAP